MKIIMNPAEFVYFFSANRLTGCTVELWNGLTVQPKHLETINGEDIVNFTYWDGNRLVDMPTPRSTWVCDLPKDRRIDFDFPRDVKSITLSPERLKEFVLTTTLSNIRNDVAGIVDRF